MSSFQPTESSPFSLNVTMDIRPERRAEFLELISADAKATAESEPEALVFVFGEDIETPNRFYLHEEYRNKAAFEFHTQTPHFAKWKAFMDTDPWVEGSDNNPKIHFHRILDPTHTEKETTQPEGKVYCLNVKAVVKPEHRESVLKAGRTNQIGARENESDCLKFEIGISEDDENTIILHEEYANGEEGMKKHHDSAHFQAFAELMKKTDPLAEPLERCCFFREKF